MSNSTERRKVLSMLAEGKITAEDAERLLDRLENPRSGNGGDGRTMEAAGGRAGAAGGGGVLEPVRGGKPLKYLRVLVESATGDNVNIRVPLALVRTGLKLSAMLPSEAQTRLHEKGIDISQLGGLQGEELIEALRELQVDVDSKDGDQVRIFCE